MATYCQHCLYYYTHYGYPTCPAHSSKAPKHQTQTQTYSAPPTYSAPSSPSRNASQPGSRNSSRPTSMEVTKEAATWTSFYYNGGGGGGGLGGQKKAKKTRFGVFRK